MFTNFQKIIRWWDALTYDEKTEYCERYTGGDVSPEEMDEDTIEMLYYWRMRERQEEREHDLYDLMNDN